MKRFRIRCGWVGLLLSLLLALPSVAQEDESGDREKALRYHGALVKRPAAGYLFDRFFNAWLESGTIEGLQKFLEARVKSDSGESGDADRLLLGYFFVRQGKDDEALEVFDVALKQSPGLGAAWVERARILGNRRLEFSAAVADLDKALATDLKPDAEVEIRKLKGRFLVRDGKIEDAMAVWGELLEANPQDELLHEDLVELLAGEGLLAEAVESSKALVAKTKDPYEKVLRELQTADLIYRSGDFEAAVTAYTGALAKTGADSWIEREILTQIERVFRRADDLDGLQSHFEELVETNPGRIGIQRAQARLLADLDQGDDAIAVYQKILEVTPGERTIREAFVELLGQLERSEEAIKQLEVLIELNAEDAELELGLAKLHHESEDKTKAESGVGRFLEKSDKNEYDYLRAARFFERYESREKARETYDAAIPAFPESLDVKEAKAAFLHRMDEIDESVALFLELGREGGLEQALRIARALSSRQLNAEAFDLLKGRLDEFENEFRYLEELIAIGLRNEEIGEEIQGWVRRRVLLAESTSELESALAQAVRVYSDPEDREALMTELTEKGADRDVSDSCLLASILRARGELTDAVALLEEEVEKASDEASGVLLRRLAKIHEQTWEFGDAAKALERLVGLPGERTTENFNSLVGLYARAGLAGDGLRWVPEWKKLSPGSSQPWLQEARLLVIGERSDEAIEILRVAARRLDPNTDVRARLAEVYRQAAKPAEAMQIYWGLYEDAEESLTKLRWVGKLYETAASDGQTEKLVEAFQERRRGNRASVEPLFALAEIYRAEENWEARRDALLEASRLKPDDLEVVKHVSASELEIGDWENALATLESARAMDKTTQIVERMARIHIEHGDPEKGYRLLADVASAKGGAAGTDANVIVEIAIMMSKGNDWETMVDFLGGYLVEFPDDYRVHYLRAVALEESFEEAEAIKAFLAVAEMDREIPEVEEKLRKAAAEGGVANVAGGSLNRMRQWAPEEAVAFVEFRRIRQSAYRYRQAGGGYYSNPPTIAAPTSVESANKLALVHAIELSNTLEDSGRQELLEDLTRLEVPMPEILLKLDPPGENFQFPEELLAESPDDPVVHAIWVLMQENPDKRAPDFDLSVRAFELLKEAYPRLAFVAGLRAASGAKSEQSAALFQKALELAEGIEEVDGDLIRSAGSISGMSLYGRSAPTQLTKEQVGSVRNLLRKWYSEIEYSGDSWVFWMLVNAEMSKPDAGRLVKLLNQQVRRAREAKGPGQSPYYYSQIKVAAPVGLPAAAFEAFPGGVTQLFPGSGSQSPYAPNLSAWKELFSEIDFSTIDDPILRLLILNGTEGREDEFRKGVAELLAADGANPDALLLAAGLAEKDEEFQKAAEYLEKVRQVARDPRVKSLIDGAMIFAAQKTGKENETVWNMGRKAAMRSINNQLLSNESQKREVIAAMETLGLHSEAKRQSLALSKAAAKRNSAMNVVRSQQQKGQAQRVEDLLERGDREQALKVASKELRRLARDASASQGSYGNWYNPLYYLRRTLQKHGIGDEVLDRLESENKEAIDRWLEFAFACHFLENKGRADKAFQYVLEKDPKRHRARAWLALNRLTGEDDQVKQATRFILAAGDEAGIGQVAKRFLDASNRSDFNELEGEPWYRARETVAAVLETFEPGTKADLSWASAALRELEQEKDWGSIELGHIRDLKPIFGDRDLDSDEPAKLEQYRLAVHRRLCRAMTKHASLAATAFVSAASLERTDENVSEWEAKAKGLLKSPILRPDYQNSARSQHFSRMKPDWSPSEFLMVEAFRRGEKDFAEKTLIPMLEEADQSATVIAFARNFAALLNCPAEDFSAKAETLAESGAIAQTIRVWELRDLPSSAIAPFVAKQIGASDASAYYSLGWVFHYADVLFEREGIDGVIEIWDLSADNTFGKDTGLEERRKTVKDLYAASSGSGRLPYNTPGYQFFHSLTQFAEHERFLFHVNRKIEEYGFQKGDRWPWRYRNGRYFNYRQNLANFLEEAPIYTDQVADFELVMGLGSDDGREMLTEMIEKLGKDAKARDLALATIKEKPDSFGKAMIGVFARPPVGAGKPSAKMKELYALIGERLDEFKALPEPSVRKWVSLIGDLERKNARPSFSDLESPAREGARWLEEIGSAGMEARVAEFLAAKQSTEIEADGDKFEQIMMSLVGTLTAIDREKARQVFLHGWGLIRQRQKTRGWDGTTSYNGWTVGAELLENYLDEGNGGLEQIGFFLELQREDREGRFPHSGWTYEFKFPDRLRKAWDAYGGPGQLGKSVEPFLKELHAEIGDGAISLLSLPFSDVTGKIPHPRKVALIAECDRIGADPKLPHAALAREWAMASRFYCAANPKTVPDAVRKKIPELDSWSDHALDSLRDETVSHSWLVPLACFYTSKGEFAVTDEIALECGNILATAMEKEADFNGWNMLYILRVFQPRRDMAGWKDIANRLRAGWWKKNRFNSRPRNTDTAFDPVEEVVLCNLNLHLSLGDTGAWKRFKREFSSTLEGNERAMMMLVEYGQHREAHDFLKGFWQRFDGNFYHPALNQFFIRYSPEKHAAIEQFLPLVSDPDLRFFAECLLRSALDPRPEEKDPDNLVVPRGKRLKDLAQVFKTYTFQDEELREHVLCQLLLDDQTIPILAGELAKSWQITDPESIPALGDTYKIELAMRAPSAHALFRLQKGEPAVVRELSEKIATSSGKTYYRREAFEHLARMLSAPIKKRGNMLTPEDAANLLPGYEAVLEHAIENEVSGFTDNHLFVSAHLLAAAMSGTPDAAIRWREAQPEPARKLLAPVLKGKAQGALGLVGQSLKVMAPKIPKPVPAERRVEIVTAFLADPVVQAGFSGNSFQKAFDMVITKKLMSEDEILERGKDLVKAWPRQGFAAAELASFETERGNFDEAIRWIDLAIETSGSENAQRSARLESQKKAILGRKKG